MTIKQKVCMNNGSRWLTLWGPLTTYPKALSQPS